MYAQVYASAEKQSRMLRGLRRSLDPILPHNSPLSTFGEHFPPVGEDDFTAAGCRRQRSGPGILHDFVFAQREPEVQVQTCSRTLVRGRNTCVMT